MGHWKTLPNDNKYHYDENGRRDRIIFAWGEERYYNADGLLHREDGPAIVNSDTGDHYYVNGGHVPGGMKDVQAMVKFFKDLEKVGW